MDVSVAILLALGVLSFLVYRLLFFNPDAHIPAVSLLEYLPNGILHPIIQHPRNYQRTMYKVATRYGRVFYSWFGSRYTLVTAVPEDISQVLTSENFRRPNNMLYVFSNVAPGGILSMPRHKHRAVRTTLRHNFSTAMLQTFEPAMNEAVTELCEVLRSMADERVVDVSATIAMTTFRVITNVAFGSGMDKKQRREFARVAEMYFQENMAEALGYPWRGYLGWTGVRKRFFECKRKVDEMCRVFIQRRLEESKEERKARTPDILDVFLEVDDGDENVVTSLVVEFALAGSHTTNQAVAWALYETCCNQRVVKEIEREFEQVLGSKPLDEPISYLELQRLAYVHKVWRETLRIHPIGSGVSRLCTSEVVLKGSGVRVPKGRNVMVHFSALQMDPEIWSEPHVFKPERWGYGDERGEGDRVPAGAFIPFGLGFRSCAGKFLAEYEGPLILAELHRRFRFSLACAPEEVVGCSAFVNMPRFASKPGGEFDMGVPVRVHVKA